jgi:hypothetical protein
MVAARYCAVVSNATAVSRTGLFDNQLMTMKTVTSDGSAASYPAVLGYSLPLGFRVFLSRHANRKDVARCPVHDDVLGRLDEKGEAMSFVAADDDEIHFAVGGGPNDLALDIADDDAPAGMRATRYCDMPSLRARPRTNKCTRATWLARNTTPWQAEFQPPTTLQR